MGFNFSISFGRSGKNDSQARSLENPSTPVTMEALADILGGSGKSISGATVNLEKSLTLSAVFRAVDLLSSTIASLPWHVYRRDFNNAVNIDAQHPLYFLLHDEPYHLYTSYKFREMMMTHILLQDGNFYAIIIRDALNNVTGLKPIINPAGVYPVLTPNDQLFYFIEGYKEPFPMRDIFHVYGFSTDGIKGKSPLRIAREAFGMGLTLQEFGQQFFANGSHLGGVVEHPNVMTTGQYDMFRESWDRAYNSFKATGKTAILQGGAKFNRIGIAPEEAQFLQSRKFSIDEIARIYGLPPHMLAQMDGATFSNIEHQGIELVIYTLLRFCRNIESESQRKLVRTDQRGYIFTRFNLDGLMRGDSVSRGQYLSTMVNSGIYSQDEARAVENLNVRGGLANELKYPLNMATEKQILNQINLSQKETK